MYHSTNGGNYEPGKPEFGFHFTRGENEINDLLGKMGLENRESFEFSWLGRAANPATVFASKEISINGKKKVLIVAVIKGTTSAGDVITDGLAALDGFGTSGLNTSSRLKNYKQSLSTYYNRKLKDSDFIYFVTGHSLGGAVSGMLGDYICTKENASKDDVFVYTYDSPYYETKGERNGFGLLLPMITRKWRSKYMIYYQ